MRLIGQVARKKRIPGPITGADLERERVRQKKALQKHIVAQERDRQIAELAMWKQEHP